jgi:hypothetical protein
MIIGPYPSVDGNTDTSESFPPKPRSVLSASSGEGGAAIVRHNNAPYQVSQAAIGQDGNGSLSFRAPQST